tara:strand:- start:86 stop:496 length:411 start_codon:yes stop_codon:yes gene_type:complete
MRPTRYTKGIGERTLDAIWAIICVKPAIVNTIEYLADWKYKNREDMKRNAIVAGCVLVIFATIGTVAYTVANAQIKSRQAEAKARAATNEIKAHMDEANSILENAIRSYDQRQREREVLEKGRRDLINDLRSQYGS